MRRKKVLMLIPEQSSNFERIKRIDEYDVRLYTFRDLARAAGEEEDYVQEADIMVAPFYEIHYAVLFKKILEKPLMSVSIISDETRERFEKDLREVISRESLKGVIDFHCVINFQGRLGDYPLEFLAEHISDELKKSLDMAFASGNRE